MYPTPLIQCTSVDYVQSTTQSFRWAKRCKMEIWRHNRYLDL